MKAQLVAYPGKHRLPQWQNPIRALWIVLCCLLSTRNFYCNNNHGINILYLYAIPRGALDSGIHEENKSISQERLNPHYTLKSMYILTYTCI